MGYMDDLERDLKIVLDEAADQRTIIDFVKNKMLDSYRNGMSAAKKPAAQTGGRSFARKPRRGEFSPSKSY